MSIGVYPGVLDTAGGGAAVPLAFPITSNGGSYSSAVGTDALSLDIPESETVYFRFTVNATGFTTGATIMVFKSGGNIAARLYFTGSGFRLEFEDGGGTFDAMTATFDGAESAGTTQTYWGRMVFNSATSEAWFDINGTAVTSTTYDTTISSYTSFDQVCFQNVHTSGSTTISEIWLGEEWAPPSSIQISGLYGFNGTNGDTTFNDEGIYQNDLTAVGSAQISTAEAKFGSASLLSAAGSGNYFETDYNDDFGFVFAGFYTVECWVNFNSLPSSDAYQIFGIWGTTGNFGWQLRLNTSGNLEVRQAANGSSIATIVSAAWTPTLGQWYHLRYTFRAAGTTLTIDGSVVDTGSDSSSYASSNVGFAIGGNQPYANGLDGYIDEVRFCKNYTTGAFNTGFTPPTAPFDRP